MKYITILRGAVRIVAPSMVSAVEATIGLVQRIPEQLNREVDKQAKRGEACETAREIVARYGESPAVTEYIKSHHSSIGTDIYKRREEKCATFTKDYLQWFFERAENEGAFETADVNVKLPKLPGLPGLPDLPDGGGIKRSLQVTALVLIGVVLLIVYMLTGSGKKGLQIG